MIFIRLLFSLLTIIAHAVVTESSVRRGNDVPVMFVFFDTWQNGHIPALLLNAIELATLTNNVVLLTDAGAPPPDKEMHGNKFEVARVKDYDDLSSSFEQIYVFQGFQVHFSNPRKIKEELGNFRRWLILCSWMIKTNTPRIFFADGDVSVFHNMTKIFDHKVALGCEGAINVDRQEPLSWVGAGESSLWTLKSITSFSKFLFAMYTKHPTDYVESTLAMKMRSKPAVVDMTLLFLWWYSHKRHLVTTKQAIASMDKWYEAGMPWHAFNLHKGDEWSHEKFKEAFEQLGTMPLPRLADIDRVGPSMLQRKEFRFGGQPLNLCNNMDSVLVNASDGGENFRYTFDHAHAWHSGPRVKKWSGHEEADHPRDATYNKPHALNFTHNIRSTTHPCPLCPSINIDAQAGGGKPESRDRATVAQLKHQPLHFLTMHYQGDSKRMFSYDVCRVLLLAVGMEKINFRVVKEECTKLVEKYGSNPKAWPCKEHRAIFNSDEHPYCF